METWQLIILLILASILSGVLSGVLSSLFHRKWAICDIMMMSQLYMSIIFDLIIGCSLFMWILWAGSSYTDWRSKCISAMTGAICYISGVLLIDVRKYNTLRNSLELLNIDSNEKLEQFIKEQEQK